MAIDVDDPRLFPPDPTEGGELSTAPREDAYLHVTFTADQSPDLVDQARRIHAEGYYNMGFVSRDAITAEGFLAADIDKARTPNTDYFLALNPNNPNDCATMRKINLPAGGSFMDLPAFGLCGDVLSAEAYDFLAGLESPEERLKEIAALSRTREASALAVHEIFRQALHEAIGKDEVWFASIVSSTQESLANSFGAVNIFVIGDDVAINDSRVKEGLKLRPVIIRPDLLLENLWVAAQGSTGSAKRRLIRTFMFMTDGLNRDKMTEEVYAARAAMLAEKAA